MSYKLSYFFHVSMEDGELEERTKNIDELSEYKLGLGMEF